MMYAMPIERGFDLGPIMKISSLRAIGILVKCQYIFTCKVKKPTQVNFRFGLNSIFRAKIEIYLY